MDATYKYVCRTNNAKMALKPKISKPKISKPKISKPKISKPKYK